ncbi:MAG TPA: amidohydrolase [Pyrinomonadaceae bacterium]|nr:amidohydrolase [Pyrinomonadaceae bacterium]
MIKINLAKTFFVLVALAAVTADASSPRSTLEQVDLLILGGTVVTMDAKRRVVENGGVAIRGGSIVAVGTRAEIAKTYRAKQKIDASGKAVVPGLINTHTHIPMVLFRGIADDLDLQEWLTKFIFPAEAKNVDEAFVRAGTRLGLAEMIRGGTTTYCDMYYFEDAIADETSKAGVRGVLGQTVIDFPVPDAKTYAEGLELTERFIKKWQGHPLIVPAIAPHAPYTVSESNLTDARALSDRLGAPLLIHLAEADTETKAIQEKYDGLRPIEFMEKIAFFNDRTIAAHVVHANEKELDLLKRHNVGIAHNPQSNMKLAAGVAPVPMMLAKDMNVGLGTDGPASNNDLNMWEEMDTAAKLHKVFWKDPKVVSAEQAFEMATIRGARALHMADRIGSLESGKLADIVVVDLDGLHQTPMYNLYSHLVYATKASDVRTVVIHGRIVMRDRRLLTLNENAIKNEAIAYRNKIVESLKN